MQTTQSLTHKYYQLMAEKTRDPISGLSHLIAALFSLVGLGWLLYLGRGNAVKEAALIVYGLGLIAMFSASGIYHLVKAGPDIILRLRKMDHSAIFLMIAGTYTPICLFFFKGFFQWGLPAVVWLMAIIGVSIKIFMIKAPRWFTTLIYLIMGWLCMMAVGQMGSSMSAGALFWLVAGGIMYSIGAVVYATKRPVLFPPVFGFHELFHIFVILGAAAHFVLIATYIAPL